MIILHTHFQLIFYLIRIQFVYRSEMPAGVKVGFFNFHEINYIHEFT